MSILHPSIPSRLNCLPHPVAPAADSCIQESAAGALYQLTVYSGRCFRGGVFDGAVGARPGEAPFDVETQS